MKRIVSLCLMLFCLSIAQGQKNQTLTEKVSGMQKFPGFFTFYWDAKAGKIWLEIDKWNTEFLYVESLPAGIGSNDIGLDRGQLGDSSIVRFDRSGPTRTNVSPFAMHSRNRLSGASTSPPKKAIACSSMQRTSIFATFTRSQTHCKEASRELIDWSRAVAPFIFQTPKTSRKTLKSKRR